MSETTGRPGRYSRTSGGLVGAMIVTVLMVVAFASVRGLVFGDRSSEVESVDWQAQVRAGRADGKLTVPAPRSLPEAWRATSAVYLTGTAPSWRMGVVTGDDRYLGIYERLSSIDDLVEDHVGDEAVKGEDVTVSGETWQSFSDPGGDYALVRRVEEPQGGTGTVLVVGTVPRTEVRDYVAGLTTG